MVTYLANECRSRREAWLNHATATPNFKQKMLRDIRVGLFRGMPGIEAFIFCQIQRSPRASNKRVSVIFIFSGDLLTRVFLGRWIMLHDFNYTHQELSNFRVRELPNIAAKRGY